MNLLLIRHGETALNVARVLQPADTPLSARGIAQAEALAARLATMNLRAIVSSDLPRALRTAQAIATATGLPIETTPLLRERNFGDWRGQPYDAMTIDPLSTDEAPPNGESMADFQRRVTEAFELVLARRANIAPGGTFAVPGCTLAVVTHGLVLRAMLGAHVQLAADMPAPTHLGNTSLSIVDAQPPHLVSLLNCTRHLGDAARDDAHALSGG